MMLLPLYRRCADDDNVPKSLRYIEVRTLWPYRMKGEKTRRREAKIETDMWPGN